MHTRKQEEAKQHPLWSDFKEWAIPNGIPLDHWEDWSAWWDCFLSGATAGRNQLQDEVDSNSDPDY